MRLYDSDNPLTGSAPAVVTGCRGARPGPFDDWQLGPARPVTGFHFLLPGQPAPSSGACAVEWRPRPAGGPRPRSGRRAAVSRLLPAPPPPLSSLCSPAPPPAGAAAADGGRLTERPRRYPARRSPHPSADLRPGGRGRPRTDEGHEGSSSAESARDWVTSNEAVLASESAGH